MVLGCNKNAVSIIMNTIVLMKNITPTIFMTRLSSDILDSTYLITEDDIYSDMQCPDCSTQMLLMQKNVLSIDYCPSYKGVWVDRCEMDKIAKIQSN